jgi:integrase
MGSGEGGFMSVFRRGDHWWISFRDSHGRHIRQSANTKSRAEAQAILASQLTKVREGKFFDKCQQEKASFKDLLDQVREYESNRERNSYHDFYKSYFNQLEAFFGGKNLNEITPKLVEDYQFKRAKETSKATANRSLAVLRKIFNLGIRWDMTTDNPVCKIDFFRVPRGRMRFLSHEEQDALLAVCKGPLKDVVTVALKTGMRRGELLGLRKKDVDFSGNFIYLEKTKSGAHRQIPMVPEVREIITRLVSGCKDEDLLFRNREGEPYSDLRTAFTTALGKAGIKEFHFHDLRHTFASDMVMAGVNIFTVSKLLGHASVQTTMIYAHLSPDHNKAEMARYDQYMHVHHDTKTTQRRD